MQTTLTYVLIKAAGIQHYLFATGKLKEMIGASQAIFCLTEQFFTNVSNLLSLKEKEDYHVLQKSAGVLRLIFIRRENARAFLREFSLHALQEFPGLPIYGVMTDMPSDCSLEQARQEAEDALERQRALRLVPQGMPLVPFVESAPLDGLPAVEKEREGELLSLPSIAKRSHINAANARLRDKNSLISATVESKVQWADDFDVMTANGTTSRIALIHIDGNDMGNFFKAYAKTVAALPLAQKAAKIHELSNIVSESGSAAFDAGFVAAVKKDYSSAKTVSTSDYYVPLRPLLMGGDDLTLIIRADLAFVFIASYMQRLASACAKSGHCISVGIGMVIMPKSYPFVKAYSLVEQLTSSAKRATQAQKDKAERPSSLDFLVLSGDVESDLDALRQRAYRADDNSKLYGRPLLFTGDTFKDFLEKAAIACNKLPRSQLRESLRLCRLGKAEADHVCRKLKGNLLRGLGGRHNVASISEQEFEGLFPGGSFFSRNTDNEFFTYLSDYLEAGPYL